MTTDLHPIIALWVHSRSMSTATERLMRERGDLDGAHEPFMYEYHVNRQTRTIPHFDVQPDHPVTCEAIRDSLIARARAAHDRLTARDHLRPSRSAPPEPPRRGPAP